MKLSTHTDVESLCHSPENGSPVFERFSVIIFITLLLSVSLAARPDLRNDFLNNGFNANVQALANTGIISAEGPEGAFYNPALLFTASKNLLLSVNQYQYDHSLFYGFYKYPKPLSKAIFALGYVLDTVGQVEYRKEATTMPDSVVNLNRQAVIVAMSRQVDTDIYMGVSATLIGDNYSNSTDSNIILALGLLYDGGELGRLSSTLKYLAEGEYSAGVGVSQKLLESLTAYVTAEYYYSQTYMTLGYKLALAYCFDKDLRFNGGWNINALTMGLSYQVNENLAFQYALINTAIGMDHSFSMVLF